MASLNKNGLLAGKVAVVTGASARHRRSHRHPLRQGGLPKVVASARTVDEGDHPLSRQP